jgi:hypothetical protein
VSAVLSSLPTGVDFPSKWLLFSTKMSIFSSYIMARTSYNSMKLWLCPFCTRPTRLVWLSKCCLTLNEHFFSYIMASYIRWIDDVPFVLTRPTHFIGFYSASSLKQQFSDRHVASLGHITLIPRQPVFTLSPYCIVLREEATNTNVIVFGWSNCDSNTYLWHSRPAC